MSNLINFKELSRQLAGGTENIRRNKIPAKYAEQVKEFTDFAESWEKKHKR